MQLKHDFELFPTGCAKWMDGEQNALEGDDESSNRRYCD